jgi:excisionase family DNA binding protein
MTRSELETVVLRAVELGVAKAVASADAEVMTLKEVAAYLKRHPKVVMKLVRSDGLPAHFISDREPRFRRTEVLAWVSARPPAPQEQQ